MIFDELDYQFLRLCGLCRYMPTGLQRKFDSPCFSASVITTLRNGGYVKVQSDKTSYKLTFAGKQILAEMGYTFTDDARMDLKRKSYFRKIKSALMNVTLYVAGIDVFIDEAAKLADKEIGYVSSLILRTDTNIRVLSGTRFLGILKIHDVLFMPYYVEGDEDWIIPSHEKLIYKSQVNAIKSINNIQIMITGETLEELWRNIHPKQESKIQSNGQKRFDEALEELASDYLLVPLNRNGATQLEIITNYRYKERIAKAIGCRTDKIYNLSECDGFKDNTPYIIAIDLNIKRIIRALKQIQRYNEKIVPKICCLPFQKKIIVKLLREYKMQNSMIVELDKNNLYQNVFNKSIEKTILQTPYVNNRGEYINANQRKVSKANREELELEESGLQN